MREEYEDIYSNDFSIAEAVSVLFIIAMLVACIVVPLWASTAD